MSLIDAIKQRQKEAEELIGELVAAQDLPDAARASRERVIKAKLNGVYQALDRATRLPDEPLPGEPGYVVKNKD